MKYIKIPIKLSDDRWLEGEPVDADGEVLCLWQASHGAALEMVQAVNEYDELVAQRDALKDALNGLVNNRMLYRLDRDERAVCTLCGERAYAVLDIPHQDWCPIVWTHAALALVKGKADETAPTN